MGVDDQLDGVIVIPAGTWVELRDGHHSLGCARRGRSPLVLPPLGAGQSKEEEGFRMATGPARRESVSPQVRGWRFIVLGLLSPVVAPFVAWIILGDPDNAGDEAAGYVFLVGGLLVGLVLVVVGVSVLLTNPKGRVELPATEEPTANRGVRGLVVVAALIAVLLMITYAGVNSPSGLWVALAVLGVFAILRSIHGRGHG